MIGRFWSITLTVSDLARSIDFYGSVLGLPLKYRFTDYAGFDCGGIELGLRQGERVSGNGEPILEFSVRDVFAAWKQLARRGINFDGEPEKTSRGAYAVGFSDPDGHRLLVVEIDWPAYLSRIAGGS